MKEKRAKITKGAGTRGLARFPYVYLKSAKEMVKRNHHSSQKHCKPKEAQ